MCCRRHRQLLGLAGLSLGVVAAAEVGARKGLGLGDPPLYEADPAYEYRLRPHQRVQRFGHPFHTDRLGLRSAELAPQRAANQRRLLVIGDSVVWGGSRLDQQLLATERIRRTTGYEVANVAAPSWGPANQLAFLRRHGLLDATDVVLVISSHDAFDIPTFESLSKHPERPTQKPWSALWEGWKRYVLPSITAELIGSPPTRPQAGSESALEDLDRLLTLVSRPGVRVGVVQFWERGEMQSGRPYAGHQEIARVIQRHGIRPIQSGPEFRQCGPADALFSDHIHPYTASGQSCLAGTILKALPPTPR